MDFAALYPRLRAFAAVVGPSEDEPDDLVQEALARMLRRRSDRAVEHPEAYLRRSILNLASNRRRSLGRLRRALVRIGTADTTSADRYPSDVSDLTRLAPEVRAVLWMVDVENATYAEVAAVLGCSEEAARARASRGRTRLRNELDMEGLA
ncbi:MAG: sigma factor [Acidimicrobiales bacterium]